MIYDDNHTRGVCWKCLHILIPQESLDRLQPRFLQRKDWSETCSSHGSWGVWNLCFAFRFTLCVVTQKVFEGHGSLLTLCSKKVAKCMLTRWEDINLTSSGGRPRFFSLTLESGVVAYQGCYHKKARCSMLLYCQLSAFVLGQLVENWKNYGKKIFDFSSSRDIPPQPQVAEWWRKRSNGKKNHAGWSPSAGEVNLLWFLDLLFFYLTTKLPGWSCQ